MGELNWAGVELGSTHSPAPSFPCLGSGCSAHRGQSWWCQGPTKTWDIAKGSLASAETHFGSTWAESLLGVWMMNKLIMEWFSTRFWGCAQKRDHGHKGQGGHPCKAAREAVSRGGHCTHGGSPWLVLGVWHWNSASIPLAAAETPSLCSAKKPFCKEPVLFFCFFVEAPEWKMLPSLPLGWSS